MAGHARLGRWTTAMAGAALAACGPTDHPSASTPAANAPYFVALPVPSAQHLVNHPPAQLATAIAALQRGFVGKAGIAIRAVDAGWTVEAGGRQRLPQQSVSKLWVAITVLDQLDSGRLRLDQPVQVRTQDLTLFHQPIAFLVTKTGAWQTTVGDLPAIVPEITGRAWITGMGQYLLDADDPFPAGFAL